MPADSLAVFSQHWNMWKKLVFYISQLVASSAGWPVTPHRDPNAHKGSVPNELTAFPERNKESEGGRGALTMGDLCSATQGKRYQVSSPHTASNSGLHAGRDVNTYALARTHILTGEEVAWEVNPIRKWNNGSKGVLHNTSSAPFPKPTWRVCLICIQIRSCCITSGANYGVQMGWYVKVEWSDWMDNFNLAKNGNPIQQGKEERITPPYPTSFSVFSQVWGFSDISFLFHASLFLMSSAWSSLSLCM